MRIVQVVSGLDVGGAEKLVLNLCRWFQEQEHQVEVVNVSPSYTLLPNFVQFGIQVRNLHMLPFISRWYPLALVHYLRMFRPDVVHCHNTAWLKAATACRWTQTPCVMTLHNYHERWLREHKGRMLKAIRYTKGYVGIEPRVSELILRELPVKADQVHYISNGIPDILNTDPPHVVWGVTIPGGAKIIGMVSRLADNKDPHTLVDAMVDVHIQHPEAHLVFVGTGPLEERVRQHIYQMGAEEYIHLLGLRQDIPAILHSLDIFVLSSHLEGQPLAVIEAMSAQRPIVATNVGGNSILLDGGQCGILVPPRNPHALAEAILDLLENREKAKQLARNARQRFLEHFTIDVMGKRYLDVYQRAIEEFRLR